MIKTNCMHYNEKKMECDCLNDTFCEYEKCNFFKTKEQDEKIKEKCRKRLEKLRW